jgi:hypothetical protein
MKKMINQAPIVRYRASVCEIFFLIFGKRLFQQNQYSGLTLAIRLIVGVQINRSVQFHLVSSFEWFGLA